MTVGYLVLDLVDDRLEAVDYAQLLAFDHTLESGHVTSYVPGRSLECLECDSCGIEVEA